MPKNVIIIGAGYAGLSVGALLAQKGYQVRLIEKNSTIGGRARLWESKGYQFDMGPSWYLMPEVFERFFTLFGRDQKDYYELKKLQSYYKVFFEGRPAVTITDHLDKTKALFEGFEKNGGQKLDAYLKKAAYKYKVALQDFLYKEYTSLFSFFNKRIVTEGLKLDVFTPLEKFVSHYFSDERSHQILEYAMVFLGTSPKNAPALYSIMSHVDLNLGVYFPTGGLNAVAKGIHTLFTELGGEVLLGQDIDHIEVKNGRAVAVCAGSQRYEADIIVNAGDYAHGELKLLDKPHRSYSEKYWKKRVMAPSMFIVYLGVNKPLEGLEHHNLYFAHGWQDHFKTIFDRPSWPDNPCFYLSAITKTDAKMAPLGKENLFLLVPVAPGLEDPQQFREAYLKKILAHVEDRIGQKFQDNIEVCRVYSHSDFEKDYHAFQGTALGLAHTLFQTAVFRPAHRSRRVKNLFYTGQYTHPGVGVPMTLISSEVVAQQIMQCDQGGKL